MASEDREKVNYQHIPSELRGPALWLQYYLKPDAKHPEKKPRKQPEVKWGTPADRTANLRSLDYLIANRQLRPGGGYQRWVDPTEGFVYIDIDRVRKPETGEVEPWADTLVQELATYTEVSPSGKGLRIVARATLPEDYHRDPDQVEIYSGHINKLMAMTGDVYGIFAQIEERQAEVTKFFERTKKGEFCKELTIKPDTMLLPDVDVPDPSHWREVFHLGSDLSQRDPIVFIDKILAEGITGIGSHSGVGKTWIGLSIAHALISGQPLFSRFAVKKKVAVLYLVPEMGGNAFRKRMEKMHISMDGNFFCQTVRDGAIDLDSPFLLEAVSDTKAVVILDTAIRFLKGDEQSSAEIAQGFGARMFNLINHGAQAIIFMQHRAKGAKKEALSLENALRGTTDFGAMCDCVWALEHAKLRKEGATEREREAYLKESELRTRLYVECVKPRDMEPADPFVIQGRPYIDERGDFVVLDLDRDEEPDEAQPENKDEAMRKYAAAHPAVGVNRLQQIFNVGPSRVEKVLGKKKDGLWVIPDNGIPVSGTLR